MPAAWLLQPGSIRAQDVPASPCGGTVTVERGDTLRRIAERCDVTEGMILRANPRIQGSADLQAGATLQLRPVGAAGTNLDQAVDRLGTFASNPGSFCQPSGAPFTHFDAQGGDFLAQREKSAFRTIIVRGCGVPPDEVGGESRRDVAEHGEAIQCE